jgi:hypothetical protein
MFDSDAQAQQRGRQVRLSGDARSAFDRGLHGTQTRGVLNEPDAGTDLVSVRSAATDVK